MSLIEKVTNLVVVATCILVGGDILRQHLNQPRTAPLYQAGDRIKDTPSLLLRHGDRTLILMTASTCHFCEESMPFFVKLVDVARQSRVRVIGAAIEDTATHQSYLQDHGVVVDSAISAVDNGLRPQPTPTLILVGQNGTILRAWHGKLDSLREQEVIASLQR